MGLNKIFKCLYKVIVIGEKPNECLDNTNNLFNQIMKLANKNKVLLEFLRKIDYNGPLRIIQERKLSFVIRKINELEEILDGVEHYYFKLVKPVTYVPSDIDILISDKNIEAIIRRLKCHGYRVVVSEPYTITLIHEDMPIDLYTYPSIAGSVIYLDAEEILENTTILRYHNVKIPSLSKSMEALVTATHAVYKDRLYTLNDYLTIYKYISNDTFEVAYKTNTLSALKTCLGINTKIDRQEIILPYRIPIALYLNIVLKKAISDRIFVSSTFLFFRKLADRRLGYLIYKKIGDL